MTPKANKDYKNKSNLINNSGNISIKQSSSNIINSDNTYNYQVFNESVVKKLSIYPDTKANNRNIMDRSNSITSNNSIYNMIYSTNNNSNHNLNNLKYNAIPQRHNNNSKNNILDSYQNKSKHFNNTINNTRKASSLDDEFNSEIKKLHNSIKIKEKEFNEMNKTYQALKSKFKNKTKQMTSLKDNYDKLNVINCNMINNILYQMSKLD